MVKITNGINVFEVTNGAYEGIYKHQGYQIVSEEDMGDFVPDGAVENGSKTANDIFVEEIRKKPISQWSKDEVKRYAAIEGIDLAGTKSVNDAKDVIKKSMDR